MILVVTHTADIGADLVIRHFLTRGIEFLRLDTDQLGTPNLHFGFADGEPILIYGDQAIQAGDISAVWARRFARPKSMELVRPEYRQFTIRELQEVMEAFLESVAGLTMNSLEADRKAGNRLYQSVIARSVGFLVPDTLVTQEIDKAKTFLSGQNRAIAKAISFGAITEAGDQVAHTTSVNTSMDFGGLVGCPVLLQSAIHKKCEWRVTTVGDRLFTARTRLDVKIDDCDWRRSPNVAHIFEACTLPADISEKFLYLCKRGGIYFGTHDLIETPEGDFYFLETNPAGQWGWLELTIGLPIGEAVASFLCSSGS